MRIAVTADIHWGHGTRGDEATRLLVQTLEANPPDVLLLGGDLGTAEKFAICLQQFAHLPCIKAVVPGNHDLWVTENDSRGDSLNVYQEHLPNVCREFGCHFLDHEPLVFPEADLAIVGTVNWYDYSWSIERMKAEIPDWEWHLQNKAFTRGRHNDGRFVRWPTDDVRFTADIVARFEQHLTQALTKVASVMVLTHHPAFGGISFPRKSPLAGLDPLLWAALSGNTAIEAILTRHADRVPYIFSGHTHRAIEARLGISRGYNIGGDYHFKRMLIVNWPAGAIETHIFGDPERGG